jgi:hypothetical protein
VYFLHHVLAVNHDRGPARHAQGNVQDGATLGEIDLLAAEHRVDSFAQAAFFREREKQAHGFVGDPVLGVVEENAAGLGGETLATRRIVGEKLAQRNVLDFFEVRLQRFPRGDIDGR